MFFSNKHNDFNINKNSSHFVSLDTWHKRLGHPSPLVLKNVITPCKLPIEINSELSFYFACKLGKIHTLPFESSISHCTKPLKLVHSNLWSLTPIASLSGHLYYVH